MQAAILKHEILFGGKHAEALAADTAQVLRPLGLTLSMEKIRITHIKDGIDFLRRRIKRDLGRRGRRPATAIAHASRLHGRRDGSPSANRPSASNDCKG